MPINISKREVRMTDKEAFADDKSTFYGKIILFLTLLSFVGMLVFGFVSFSTMAIAKNRSGTGKATAFSPSSSLQARLEGAMPDTDD